MMKFRKKSQKKITDKRGAKKALKDYGVLFDFSRKGSFFVCGALRLWRFVATGGIFK
jgi:hypothetical protein